MTSKDQPPIGRLLILKLTWLVTLAAIFGLYRLALWATTFSPVQVVSAMMAAMTLLGIIALGLAAIAIYRDIVLYRAKKRAIRARNEAHRAARKRQAVAG